MSNSSQGEFSLQSRWDKFWLESDPARSISERLAEFWEIENGQSN